MVLKFVTKNGMRVHGPPYTKDEEADFYRRWNSGPLTVYRGERSVWTDDEQMQLVKKVDAINAERKRGIEDAIRILQRRETRYRQKDHDTESRKSKTKNPLAARYYEAAEKFKPLPEGLWGGDITRRSKTRKSTRR